MTYSASVLVPVKTSVGTVWEYKTFVIKAKDKAEATTIAREISAELGIENAAVFTDEDLVGPSLDRVGTKKGVLS